MRDVTWTAYVKWVTLMALLAFCTNARGNTAIQISNQDVTSTQAIIRVRTDQRGFCTYRISQGSAFAQSINDVNWKLFPGSNIDSRLGSILDGQDASRVASSNHASDHIFVAGTRTASQAVDGIFYSRALETNTNHWVGVTCGTDSEVSATFKTSNIPLGNHAPEQMPFDVKAFGNVAVPSIDWNNRAATYIDPTWGTELHRMTGPSDLGFYSSDNAFTQALSGNGHWINAANALSSNASKLATCDPARACSSADVLALIAVIPTQSTNYVPNGSWDPHMSYLDFLVKIWGSGTDSAAVNRAVSVCWSIDDQTCFSASQVITLPRAAAFAGTAPRSWSVQTPWSSSSTAGTTLKNIVVSNRIATVNFASAHTLSRGSQICVNGIRDSIKNAHGGNGLNGCHTIISTPHASSLTFATNAVSGTYQDSELMASPTFPKEPWFSWGPRPPLHSSIGMRTGGTVTALSGSLTLNSSGQSISNFDPNWPQGTKIYIAGSDPSCLNNLCTIDAMIDALHLRLKERLTISNAAWTSANFALLVKKNTSTGAVSLSAGYDFVYSANFNSGLDGSGDLCNSNYVKVHVDADGNLIPLVKGYLCVANPTKFLQATPIY
jgi:hypothetical protein